MTAVVFVEEHWRLVIDVACKVPIALGVFVAVRCNGTTLGTYGDDGLRFV